jgi:GNAT superfamily N-acetyltransferase
MQHALTMPDAAPVRFATALSRRLPALAFRPIVDADHDFLRALYAEVRRDELAPVPWPPETKAAFLADQFRLQHAHYTAHYAGAEFLLIARPGRKQSRANEGGDESIGRVYLHRSAQEICLMEISLLEAERGRGIGGAIIATVLERAALDDIEVTLHVEPNNPARRLYERLGFVPDSEVEGAYQRMRWQREGAR